MGRYGSDAEEPSTYSSLVGMRVCVTMLNGEKIHGLLRQDGKQDLLVDADGRLGVIRKATLASVFESKGK